MHIEIEADHNLQDVLWMIIYRLSSKDNLNRLIDLFSICFPTIPLSSASFCDTILVDMFTLEGIL